MIKTDAINLCLRYIGESPLPEGTTLESLDPQHEANIISQIIDETAAKIALQGWWFNTESWEFQPDSTTGKIQLSDNILYLKSDTGNYLVRGTTLYNADDKSYNFTSPVAATVVWNLKFSELPTSFAFYVAYTAAQEAQMLFSSDSTLNTDLAKRISEAFIRLQREHLRYQGHNLMTGQRITTRTGNPVGVV